ncbi:hypothetical protein N4G69_19875 [Streptomyces mirabilis]|uniref:DUF6932 family protein n=1 Tax=Streptomyces mirabilis TaxID=68239 RepID=UPI0021C15E08|nr:hypothetical protein [Streptomyces mirabilis]MCT9107869.1 hypothetical protein [Streptomyces mirabilis]
MLPSFAANGFLPLGRYSISLEEAESMLVSAPEFQDSATRAGLWGRFHNYLDRFLTLEETYADALAGLPLIHGLWLGGSFVSTKPDPGNIDATLLIDTRAERAVRGKPGSKWLTTAFQSRERMREKFGVSPLRIGYQPVARVFEPTSSLSTNRHTSHNGVCGTTGGSGAGCPARATARRRKKVPPRHADTWRCDCDRRQLSKAQARAPGGRS